MTATTEKTETGEVKPANPEASEIIKRILNGVAPKPEEKKPEPAPEKKAEAKPPENVPEAKKEEEAPKPKKVKAGPPLPEQKTDSRSVEEVVRQVLPEIAKQNAPATPKLAPEIEREIELAKFAEQSDPKRYAGFSEKVTAFYSASDQHLKAKATELGGAKSAEFKDYLKSDEWGEWLGQNRPSYLAADRTRFQEEIVSSRAHEQAKRAIEPEIKELRRKTAELEHAPFIRERKQALVGTILSKDDQGDPALAGFVKDPVNFSKEHPEEGTVIAQVAEEHLQMIEEVYRVERDLVDVDLVKRPQQRKIKDFMARTNADMRAKYPNGIQTESGKILIDAETYMDRGLARDERYRTLTADEMASMIALTGQAEVRRRLNERREGVARSIYGKNGAPAVPPEQKKEVVEEPPSPGAVVSRASGAPNKTVVVPSPARKYV